MEKLRGLSWSQFRGEWVVNIKIIDGSLNNITRLDRVPTSIFQK